MKKDKGISAGLMRIIAIILTVFLGSQGMQLLKVSRSLDAQLEEAQKELSLQGRNLEELQIEYENIESISTVENIAREKLGFVKKDEIVFREK